MELGVPASLRSGELQLHEAVASGVPRELWSRECVGAEVKCPVAPLLVARCAWWPELGAGGGGSGHGHASSAAASGKPQEALSAITVAAVPFTVPSWRPFPCLFRAIRDSWGPDLWARGHALSTACGWLVLAARGRTLAV